MKAPRGAQSAVILGHEYVIENDHVETVNDTHIPVLRQHGFKDPFVPKPAIDPEDEDDIPADDLYDGMKKAELVDYVEERGGEVVRPIKMAVLRQQARELGAAELAKA